MLSRTASNSVAAARRCSWDSAQARVPRSECAHQRGRPAGMLKVAASGEAQCFPQDQPPIRIESMLNAGSNPMNSCMTSTTRFSCTVSTLPTGPVLIG
jgi:hypothetical protein